MLLVFLHRETLLLLLSWLSVEETARLGRSVRCWAGREGEGRLSHALVVEMMGMECSSLHSSCREGTAWRCGVAGKLARRAGELGLLSSHCYFLTGSSLEAVTAFCEELRSYLSLSSYICLQLDKEEELELCGVFQPFLRTEGELGSRSEHCAAAYCSLLALHRLSVASMKAVLAREVREGLEGRLREVLAVHWREEGVMEVASRAVVEWVEVCMQGGEGEGRQSRASSLYDSEGSMPEEKYVSQGLREESCRSSVREKSYREEVGGDRKRARSEQQEVWARVGQGLEQELESLATCCDSTRLQFPAWPHTPSREIILDLVELLQTSNLSLAEVRERLTGRDAHGRQLELDRVRNKM